MTNGATRWLLWWTLLLGVLPSAFAQSLTSTLSGTVSTDDGRPIADGEVQWVYQGLPVSTATDSEGHFLFPFVTPGVQRFRFADGYGKVSPTFEIDIDPQRSLELNVVLVEDEQGRPYWEIEEHGGRAVNAQAIQRVYTSDWIESIPTTEHLWSLLNRTSGSVVAERYDISGMHSDRQLLIGVRGSSWNQNQAIFNGVNVTRPSGAGMLSFPDLSVMESVTYAIGSSPRRQTGTGAHLIMTPKAGGQEVHGQAHLFFQSGALQGSNVTRRHRFFGIDESDERWRHYVNGNVQIGGPVGRTSWTYLGSFSHINMKKDIRNHREPVSSYRNQASLHVIGQLAPRDRLALYWSGQLLRRPQAGASPQVPAEASLNETQSFHNIHAAWTRILAKSTLELRFGVALGDRTGDFQVDARGQSGEYLFPGYALWGDIHPLEMVDLIDRVFVGAAPQASQSRETHWDTSLTYSTLLTDPLALAHRLSIGARFQVLSSSDIERAVDGVNLLFFEGEPNSVRILGSPVQTQDRMRQWDLYGEDTISLGRMSFSLGLSAALASGANVTRSGKRANALSWQDLSGHLGVAVQVLERLPLVLRGRLAHTHHQPLLSTWAAVNPEGQGVRLYRWEDLSQDEQFQPGENTQILKVMGPAFNQMDPDLKNPHVTELGMTLTHQINRALSYRLDVFRRVEHNLMSLVNTGVPFSAYDPVQAIDPGDDGEIGTGDDGLITVYNQNPETLGQDRYLLTNPETHNGFSEGFEARLNLSWGTFESQMTATHYRAVASTAPGMSALENDTSSMLGVFDNPNNAIAAYGSNYFDRGTLARLWTTYRLPLNIQWSVVASYQDGLPYGRYLPVSGLNQGVTGVLTRQRGPGAAGSLGGYMTTHYRSVDFRFARDVSMGSGRLSLVVDIFNVSNNSMALAQTDDTSPTHLWRIPMAFQTPRSVQLGLRHRW